MDPVADMLTIVRNGYLAKKPEVTTPYSKFKLEIAKILERENFVSKINKKDSTIIIDLLLKGHKTLHQIKKVSKPGLRVYTKSKKIKPLKGGRGLIIISTPKGVMTAKEAKKKNLGGEVICEIW